MAFKPILFYITIGDDFVIHSFANAMSYISTNSNMEKLWWLTCETILKRNKDKVLVISLQQGPLLPHIHVFTDAFCGHSQLVLRFK